MRILFVALALFLTVAGSVAHAAPLTFSPTPTGLTFTIENTGSVGDSYAIELKLTTSTLYEDSGDPDYLAAFSLDFSDGALGALTLIDSPEGFSWLLKVEDEVAGASDKCGGEQLGAGCVEEDSELGANLVLKTAAAQTYTWLFHVDLGSSGFSDITTLDVGVATLKSNGKWHPGDPTTNFTAFAGSLALEGSDQRDSELGGDVPVPEPTSLVLLGSGLLLAASRMRRRR